MFPLPACGSVEQIRGARFEVQRDSLPTLLFLPAEPELTRGAEREAGHLAEYRPVAMPADGRAGCIGSHEGLLDVVHWKLRRASHLLPEPQQEIRDGRGWRQPEIVEIVAPSEGNGLPQAGVAAELELAERQSADLVDQLLLALG